ncbi:MAG: dTDP-4-amino-4,6-dideoxygalactose transaminase [Gammaproteobacteria bacterium]|nr:dTDP-4-amino-4,6-dideoxygalactose transaminase [Gammaproteobacteria bacterium]
MGRERDYIADVLAYGHLASGGNYSARVRAVLEEALGVSMVLLTTSCSDALEMSALLLNICPGDEVIVPSFSFVTVAGAFALRGARIIFADIRADTLNIDETKLASLISPRTRAIVIVHYAGVACEMDAILALAARHHIAVVEDLAHGPFATYKGRSLGTFGTLACLSFHETKNFSCGEGGALVVNDSDLFQRAEIVYQKGTDKSRFLAGGIDKYIWRDLGSSFALSDLLAAFLFGQLEVRQEIQNKRSHLWQRYDTELCDWADAWGVGRPIIPAHCSPAYHTYYLVMPNAAARDGLIAYLKARGILSVFHYAPLHLSDMGRRYGGRPGDHPVAERIGSCLARLPFFTTLSESDQDEVVSAVRAYKIPSAGCILPI